MQKENTTSDLIVRTSYEPRLRSYEEGLLDYIGEHGLPTEAVLVSIAERMDVLENLRNAIARLNDSKRRQSLYISKFIAATASGLFDAALNYLWDETVSELRQRVAKYDLSYFFDNALKNSERRKIKNLLAKVKSDGIDTIAAEQIATSFDSLTTEQVNTLASGFFGIYSRLDTAPQARENIHCLLPHLWHFVDESTRHQFGMKYAQFVVNTEKEAKLARQFLEIVSAVSYIPDNLRAVEIKNAVENLLSAHRGFSNFYNEPPFARALQRLVGEVGTLPPQVNEVYVLGLVEVFLTNGHGVARNAESIYYPLLNLFDSSQALIAILAFRNIDIASKLQFKLCQQKYYELLGMMKIKISSNAVKDFIKDIENYKGQLYNLKDVYRQNLANLQKIMKL